MIVVRSCPLPTCSWGFREPPPLPAELAITEKAVQRHLSTHDIREWLEEIGRLNDLVDRYRADIKRMEAENFVKDHPLFDEEE